MSVLNNPLPLKFRVKFATKACFELFAPCDVSFIRLTRKNSVLRLSHQIFLRNTSAGILLRGNSKK